MTTHRFFLPDVELVPGQPVDLTPLARQLARVLRLHTGAEIHLLDNRGACFLTRIETLDDRRGTGTVLAAEEIGGEPAARLTLYQCSLKADKFEWVLQKGTELGVAGFVVIEGAGVADAAYFTAITLSTVGYGETFPLSPWGRLWTIAVITVGVAAVSVAFTSMIAALVGGVDGLVERHREFGRCL